MRCLYKLTNKKKKGEKVGVTCEDLALVLCRVGCGVPDPGVSPRCIS